MKEIKYLIFNCAGLTPVPGLIKFFQTKSEVVSCIKTKPFNAKTADKTLFLRSENRNFMLKEDSRTNLRDAKIAATQEKARGNPKKKCMSRHARNAAAKRKFRSSPVRTDLFTAANVSQK